ncbi:hypothetical protein VTN77DRAFT_6797 [Rasamsonia byssochlamydoides]|uniref:uncharacterized protein n=1 Tax=Rasamsonia byssochlamydoides TaxID=89139 RepID=UPI00374259AF
MRGNSRRRGRSAAAELPSIYTRSPTPVVDDLNHTSVSSWANQVSSQSSSAYNNHLALPQGNGAAGYATPVEYDYMEYRMADCGNGDGYVYRRFQTRSTASDSHSQTQLNLEVVSGQSYQVGGDGSQYDRAFYSDEASTSNNSEYHNRINQNLPYLSDPDQGENPVFSQQDLQGVQGASPDIFLEDHDPILDAFAQMLEYSPANNPESLRRVATLADQSNDPWNQLRIPQDSSEQLSRALREESVRLYYGAVMGSVPDNPDLLPDDTYEGFPNDSSIGVRGPDTNNYHFEHEASNGGRRRGGRQRGSHLPTETANNARTVRHVGACLRCMTLREQCSDGSPCKKCLDISLNGRKRKWKGCYRSFTELAEALSPGLLEGRLSKEAFDHYLRENGTPLRDNQFPLPLNMGFGGNFVMTGMEFIPNTPEASASRAVYTDGRGLAATYSNIGLPVLPSWKKRGEMGEVLGKWLRNTVNDRESIYQWLEHCFPRYTGGTIYWIQPLLWEMWIYSKRCFHEEREWTDGLNGTLLRAWKMAIVATSLSIQIIVPEDARKTVLDHLQHREVVYDDPAVNSTRLINRGVKHLFLDIYKQLVGEVLSELDKFMREKPSSIGERAWGHMFCVAILLIVVIGHVQISLVDNHILSTEIGLDQREETLEALEKLEEGFSNVTQVFHGRHSRTGTKSGGSRSGRPLLHESSGIRDGYLRQLVSRVQEIKQQYKKNVSEFRNLKLTKLAESESEFFALNTQRLLATFLASVFPDHRARQ